MQPDYYDPLIPWLMAGEAAHPQPFPRASVYHGLVHNGLHQVIETAFPVTSEVLGEDGFAALVQRFLDAGGPTTRFYRDIPGDAVTWAVGASEPLADLMHYEWLELVAARHPAEIDDVEPAPNRVVRPNPTLQAAVFARPVHLMSADNPDPEPFAAPSAYLVWRRPNSDEVAFHRVGLAIAKAIAQAFIEPATVEELAERVAAGVEGLEASALATALADVCQQLRERGGLV